VPPNLPVREIANDPGHVIRSSRHPCFKEFSAAGLLADEPVGRAPDAVNHRGQGATRHPKSPSRTFVMQTKTYGGGSWNKWSLSEPTSFPHATPVACLTSLGEGICPNRGRPGAWVCVDNCQQKGVQFIPRPVHPSKEIDDALEYAAARGWRIELAKGHAWGRILCTRQQRGGCSYSVWSTPRVPENHARQLRRNVDRCPHLTP